LRGYREDEPMGGFDPYSNSKGCAELVTSSWRQSFFNTARYSEHGCALASARAGNVIGGGDWASDRLIPDILRTFARKQAVMIRNPHAIRPWQHVLEPLSGYLELAERLYLDGPEFAEAWNFGPEEVDEKPVEWIVGRLAESWGEGAGWQHDKSPQPHEASYLKLDCTKAKTRLGWHPAWGLEEALNRIVCWHKAWLNGENMHHLSLVEINDYMNTGAA
jgi:CDP-glucose 4,6-dehydratase